MSTEQTTATTKQEAESDMMTMEEYFLWLREFLMQRSPEYAAFIASTSG